MTEIATRAQQPHPPHQEPLTRENVNIRKRKGLLLWLVCESATRGPVARDQTGS